MSRQRNVKAEPPAEVDLPKIITPMLDMVFQILFFFIVIYHPSALEGQMDMMLPAAGEAKAETQAEVDPNAQSDTEIDLPSELTVVIKSGASDSAPSHYVVEGLQGPSPPLRTLGELQSHLVKARVGLTNKDDIKIQGDSHLKYAYVVEVMDVCTKSEKDGGPGFKRVGFKPPPGGGD